MHEVFFSSSLLRDASWLRVKNGEMPNFELENMRDEPVFGLDEVGRGPLAGPVVAACVHFPKDTYTLPFIPEINDSKKLSERKLEALYGLITQHCVWAVAEISVEEIDRINILQASLKAMEEALKKTLKDTRFRGEDVKGKRDDICQFFALVDGNKLPALPCPARSVIKGDSKSVSIAAASIVAKVTRDRIMRALHEAHPHYDWHKNVGYGTKAHREAIDRYGITAHHRKSFAPVKNFLACGSTRDPLKSAG